MPEALSAAIAAGHFEFLTRDLDLASGRVELGYRLGSLELFEYFWLPGPIDLPSGRQAAVDSALDLLHWICAVSYWKAACPARFRFAGRLPDAWQSEQLTHWWRKGLAEFAWTNRLDPDRFASFPSSPERPRAAAANLGLKRRCLVPLGGGKDSLVALERLRAAGHEIVTVQVGSAALIERVASRLESEHRVIRRRLAPALDTLNRAGARNGHVPITAIHAAVLTLAALLWDFDSVVFANERSADEASLTDERGRAVNHQYAKSFDFEHRFDDWVRRYLAADLNVFSILRQERELAICREFSNLPSLHSVFSSCNRNFHLAGSRTERWCGECPKCRSVFLGLAPFLSRDALHTIFGRALLDEELGVDGFRALLALDGAKPLECVGEVAEARAAVGFLQTSPEWRDAAVVQALAKDLHGLEIPSLPELLASSGPHRIPERFLHATR